MLSQRELRRFLTPEISLDTSFLELKTFFLNSSLPPPLYFTAKLELFYENLEIDQNCKVFVRIFSWLNLQWFLRIIYIAYFTTKLTLIFAKLYLHNLEFFCAVYSSILNTLYCLCLPPITITEFTAGIHDNLIILKTKYLIKKTILRNIFIFWGGKGGR